jgi:AbrB family looped-hinge helix DNA binding protein
MDKLLSCPFCGGEAELYGSEDMVWSVCKNNNCCMAYPVAKFDEPEDAIEAWNKRYEGPMNPTETANDVRRIDDLGRIAIPKNIRNMLNITEGDELELIVYPSAGGVFLKHVETRKS